MRRPLPCNDHGGDDCLYRLEINHNHADLDRSNSGKAIGTERMAILPTCIAGVNGYLVERRRHRHEGSHSLYV